MLERIVICPLCDARVILSTDRYFFTISRDSKNDPREMRVMEDGKMRHACSMPSDPLSA